MIPAGANRRAAPHPLHAILLAFPVAMFPAALAADITYLNSAEIQWSNFAAWLIAAALLFGAPVVVWAIVGMVRRRRGRAYPVVLGAMWLAGLVNALRHSADGWASVGTLGLMMSIVASILALAAGWLGFAGGRQ